MMRARHQSATHPNDVPTSSNRTKQNLNEIKAPLISLRAAQYRRGRDSENAPI
jgi:hypothetical protein